MNRIPTFHAIGDWGPDAVRVAWQPSSRISNEEVDRLIETTWREALARPGIKLFDGPMCRLESWSATPESLHLALSQTSYQTFLGTNLVNPELADRHGPTVMANPVGVSCAVVTSDGFLMLGRRNSAVAYYPGRTHPFAGALEPRDGTDVFAAARRELREELSVADEQLGRIRCCGIAEDRALRHPELLFHVAVDLTRSRLEAQVDAAEHRAAVAIPATTAAVERALADPALTPVAVATVLAWGRIEFGDEWFRSRLRFAGRSQ